jgi:hypothetical protein
VIVRSLTRHVRRGDTLLCETRKEFYRKMRCQYREQESGVMKLPGVQARVWTDSYVPLRSAMTPQVYRAARKR